MNRDPRSAMLQTAPALRTAVEQLARARMVFFVGLPGTGKSLLLRELAQRAHGDGRFVHLLQWDVARPPFEAAEAGRRYPIVGGVTHVVVRKALGLWVRSAVARWEAAHPEPAHLLVGETPFVGNRFVELARREDDRAESLLARSTSRFVLPVPSREVRAVIEAERGRRALRPLHEREGEDAPPAVLEAAWAELATVGQRLRAGATGALGVAAPEATGGPPYAPEVYRHVYEHLLRHRPTEVLWVDTILPTANTSVYDLTVPRRELVPGPGEADEFIRAVERRYPDLHTLEDEVARWWDV